jgi:hypothetical protein
MAPLLYFDKFWYRSALNIHFKIKTLLTKRYKIEKLFKYFNKVHLSNTVIHVVNIKGSAVVTIMIIVNFTSKTSVNTYKFPGDALAGLKHIGIK